MNMRRSNKRGIVGIEAAIVLIAFVIVAAAFAFMVVNMGLTSTEKSKEAIQQGLKEASCPLTLDGSMLLKSESANNVSTIIIPLKTLGVKYVPMWTNETVVSIKIGTRVSVANIYSGINHTIDPSGMAFDSILNLLPKAYVASESIEIKGGEGSLLKVPILPGSVTINVNATTILKDADGKLYNMTDPSKPTLGSINYDTGVISGLTEVKDGTYQATYRFGSAATLVIENDNHDDSLDFFEKGYLIITLHPHQRVFPRDNVLIEVRPEKSAPLTIEFTVPEAIPANAYVTIE